MCGVDGDGVDCAIGVSGSGSEGALSAAEGVVGGVASWIVTTGVVSSTSANRAPFFFLAAVTGVALLGAFASVASCVLTAGFNTGDVVSFLGEIWTVASRWVGNSTVGVIGDATGALGSCGVVVGPS